MKRFKTRNMMAKAFKVAWIGLVMPLAVTGKEPFPAKELTSIAAKHQIPMPPKNARLVLAHTESWQVLGNESTSRDPAIYSPAFLLKENAGGGVLILRGTEVQVLEPSHQEEPLWRPFSDQMLQPKLGGYVSDFDRLSALVCAVQLAARGDEGTAQRIWQKVEGSRWFSDGEPHEDVQGELKNPSLLLGKCIFIHLKNRVLDEPQEWSEIYDRMKALFGDFPNLKTELRHKTVFDGLYAALNAKSPATNSTEALLISWSREPRGGKRGNRSRGADGGGGFERQIILRGADAVPDLIGLLGDPRITTHEFPPIMNAPSRVQLLGELAQQLLEAITGIHGKPSWEQPDAAELRAWYEKSRQAGGEEKNLTQSLFERRDGRITQVNEAAATILAQKYPQKLPALCEEFSKEAKPETQPFALVQAVVAAGLPKETKVQVLSSFAQRGSLEHQRAVLQCLAPLDPAKCADLLLPIIRKLPPDSAGPYWTCPEAALTHCVMLLEDDTIWSEYLRAAKQSSVGLRMEIMNPMNYTYIGQTNRSRRLAFLAAFLNDENVREKPQNDEHSKFSGPCAAFTYKRIRVRDFAAEVIASILELPDHPDEFWTSAQWAALRQKVERKLAGEKLPKL